jgi:hypothetical protein
MPAGRPSLYSPELADTICERISSGRSLNKITSDEDMPAARTVWRWLDENDEFRQKYARARELQAEYYADEMTDIADSAHDRDSAAAVRVRVDTRKWIASKLKPKKYGDKLDVEHSGTVNVEVVRYGDKTSA